MEGIAQSAGDGDGQGARAARSHRHRASDQDAVAHMIRDILRMGDPRLLERSQRGRALRHAELAALLAGHARHDGRARRRRPRRAADRRAAARRDLRRRAQPALSRRRAGAVHRARQSRPDAARRTTRRRAGKAACRCPGLRGVVPRYTRCATRDSIRRAGAIAREVDGFHARVVQHECDHLDGILYPMRIARHAQVRLHRHAVSGQRRPRRVSRRQIRR